MHFAGVYVIEVPEAGESGPKGAGNGAERGGYGFVDGVRQTEEKDDEQGVD